MNAAEKALRKTIKSRLAEHLKLQAHKMETLQKIIVNKSLVH